MKQVSNLYHYRLETEDSCRRWANFDIDEFDRELAASEFATTDCMVSVHSESDNALLRYGRYLGFYPTGNGAVRSAVPKTPP